MKVVIVEPKKPAYITEIGSNLESMKKAVGGYIEPIYYLDDPRAVMVGNEEAKLIGLEGNRRFGNRIVTRTFFICGIAEDDFDSLSDDLCERYVREFAEPQDITPDEVQRDMGCFVFS